MGKPRNERPEGGMYHVYARGNDRRDVFIDDTDRHLYLDLIGDVVGRGLFRCTAYCLMRNHVHLLVETDRASLGDAMRLLHGRYARTFNRRHDRVGHLFQSIYGSTTIDDDSHACWAIRYIARNPVQAGLCTVPQDWRWSSCAATLAGRPEPGWLAVERLLGCFGWLGGSAHERYAEIVATA